MLPQERYDLIIQQLKQQNIIKMEELMAMFDISIETVRRDLNYLEKKGIVKKIYGGATLVNKAQLEPDSVDRLTSNLLEKEAIGQKCSEFINDGDCILLEIGTTTLQVAKALKNKKNLTVITNSIYIINELVDSNINLYVIGGRVRHEEKAISGAVSMFELDHFNITKSIIGAGAVTAAQGVSDYNIEEALVRKRIIQRSKEVYLVADHTKFGFTLPVNICPISDIDLIVTGRELESKIIRELEDANAKLVFAN